MKNEVMPISEGLFGYINDKTSSGISVKRISDALSLEVVCDRNLNAFAGVIDDYYLSLGFEINPDSTRSIDNFTLRTYNHEKARSKAQVMISQKRKYHYHVFVNDFEDSIGTQTRTALKLSDAIKNQRTEHN